MNTLIHPFCFRFWGAIRSQGAVAISLVALWFLVRITIHNWVLVKPSDCGLWRYLGALGLGTQGLVSGATV